MISPSGTVSNVLSAPNFILDVAGNNVKINKIRMGINRFLDEKSAGNWQVVATDVNNTNSKFLLNNVKLEIHGTN